MGLNQPGFSAADESGSSTPPDTTGAIGPNYYLEFVNSELVVYSRSTLAAAFSQTEDAFTGSTSTCDGQIKWDQQAQRWEYWSLDCGAVAGSNGWTYGWSKTADPSDLTNGWCKYHFTGAGSTLNDYGKLGNNDNFLIVGTNDFPDSGVGNGSSLFAMPKPSNGTTTCPTSETVTQAALDPSVAVTPEPANIYGSSATGYAVAVNPTSMAALRLYRIAGAAGSTPTFTDLGDITVPAFSVPASVPQPSPASSGDVLDSSDARLTQAVAAFDPDIGTLGIWTQHTIDGGGPSVVRWYELKDGASTPVQTGTISAGTNFAFNGAISPSTAGNTFAIHYNEGGSTQNVLVRAQTHSAGMAAGSLTSAQTVATSTGVSDDFSCPSSTFGTRPCRWGDYAGASPDPNSSTAVWGTAELNGPSSAGNAVWQTQNFSLSLATPPAATTGSATGVTYNAGTLNGSVNPNGLATTYHFDYGPTTGYGTSAPSPDSSAGSGTSAQAVSQVLSGLTSSTLYHYRTVATNSSGTSYGTDQTFTTSAPPPTATTGSTGAPTATTSSPASQTSSGAPQGTGSGSTTQPVVTPVTGGQVFESLRTTLGVIGAQLSQLNTGTVLSHGSVNFQYVFLEAGTVTFRLILVPGNAQGASKHRRKKPNKAITLASGSATRTTPGAATVFVRLNAAGRRLPKKAKAIRLTFGATFQPATGAKTQQTETRLTLRRHATARLGAVLA